MKLTESLRKIYESAEESLQEDTVKQGNHWVNKGDEGTHGKFKTKKEADAQRKAMFAGGYKESLSQSLDSDIMDALGKICSNHPEATKRNILDAVKNFFTKYFYLDAEPFDESLKESDEFDEDEAYEALMSGATLKDVLR